MGCSSWGLEDITHRSAWVSEPLLGSGLAPPGLILKTAALTSAVHVCVHVHKCVENTMCFPVLSQQ